MLNNIQAKLQLHGKRMVDYISWWTDMGQDQGLWQPAKSSIWVRESYLSLMCRHQVREMDKIIGQGQYLSASLVWPILSWDPEEPAKEDKAGG